MAMSNNELGKLLIGAGQRLRTNDSIVLDEALVLELVALVKKVPKSTTGGFKTQKHTDLDIYLIEKIRSGSKVSNGNDKRVGYALTKLRRQGLIENTGTRTKPNWVLIEVEPKETYADR